MTAKTLTIALTTLSLALAACDKKVDPAAGGGEAATLDSEPVSAVSAPADGDWSQVTVASKAGGFIMGNPAAKVRVVEYGSMTCPHCAEFEESGVKPMIDGFVKSGKASWEFRNYVRDSYDITASLVARCGGAASFFGLTRGLYATQRQWIEKVSALPQDQLAALQNLPPAEQFRAIAKAAGFTDFAAMRGLDSAKLDACLADQGAATALVDATSAANAALPNFPGTPTFLVNGKMLEMKSDGRTVWQQLEAAIKAAGA